MNNRGAIIGGAQLVGGIAVAYLLYVKVGYDDGPWSLGLLLGVTAIALVAFIAFSIARRAFVRRWSRVLAGLAICYTTIFALLLVLMRSPEERMWLPVLLILGGVCTAPAVAGAWLASGSLFIPSHRGGAQQAVAADRPKTGAG